MSFDKDTKLHGVDETLDIEAPQHWPVSKKVAVSLAASGYTFCLTYTATAYTTGLKGIMKEFDVSMTKAILPYSLFFWGIMFAPLYSPHVSERFGRNRFYRLATLGLGLFTIGAAYSKTYTSLAVCRFFAGLFGGSNVVQIEGTFADVWPALFTCSYYVFIIFAQNFGAAVGAVIGWHVVPDTDWRYSQYTSLMFILAALLLGMGIPETYLRELIRRKARSNMVASPLEPALSGVAFAEMARLTAIRPLVLVATDPIVTMITLYLGLQFGVLLSWFIAVPAVLQGVAGYAPHQVGSAFATAIGGTAVAGILSFIIDQITSRVARRHSSHSGPLNIEYRMVHSTIGAILITTSLFWIGWTASPSFSPVIPIVGNGIYVTGSAMNLIGFVSYLFDAYGRQGTLSALTIAACFRLAMAGIVPLVIIPGIMHLTGAWAVSMYGFFSIAFLPFPIIIMFAGQKLRMRSSAYDAMAMAPMAQQMGEQGQDHGSENGNANENGGKNQLGSEAETMSG